MHLTLILFSNCAWEQIACLLSLWRAVIFPIIDREEEKIVKERERKRENTKKRKKK